MDNKIILDWVAKNLEEIKLLVDSLRNEEKADQLLIEITVTKAKILYQELMLLQTNEPATDTKTNVVVAEETLFSDDEKTIAAEEKSFSPDNDVVIDLPEEVISTDNEPEELTPEEPTVKTDEIVETETEMEEVPSIESVTEEDLSAEPVLGEDSSIEPAPEEDLFVEPVTEEDLSIEPIQESDLSVEPVTEEVSAIEQAIKEEYSLPSQIEPIEPEEEELLTAKTETEAIFADTIEETETNVEEEPVQETDPVNSENTNEPYAEMQELVEKVVKNNEELSVNDKIAATLKLEPRIKGIPVTNIMGAIGINDRFLFTRELFTNDSQKFEETVNHLDKLSNLLEAIEYLEANFKWTKNEASLKFMELLKRRFEN